MTGWDGLKGDVLKRVRESSNSSLDQYADVRGDEVFFFKPSKIPEIVFKVSTFLYTLRTFLKYRLKTNMNLLDGFTVRKIECHRNGFRTVIKGSIVLSSQSLSTLEQEQDFVRQKALEMIKKAKKANQNQLSLLMLLRFLPNGYISLNVYNKSIRDRQLGTSGLVQELVCVIKRCQIKRIKDIDIFGGVSEDISNGYRIVWNKSYLENEK